MVGMRRLCAVRDSFLECALFSRMCHSKAVCVKGALGGTVVVCLRCDRVLGLVVGMPCPMTSSVGL